MRDLTNGSHPATTSNAPTSPSSSTVAESGPDLRMVRPATDPEQRARDLVRRWAAAAPARDVNAGAVRGFLSARVWELADVEPSWADTDTERLARLVELVGEIAAAHNHAHKDIDAELMRAAGCVLAWLDARGRDAAA